MRKINTTQLKLITSPFTEGRVESSSFLSEKFRLRFLKVDT